MKSDGRSRPSVCRRPSSIVLEIVACPSTTVPTNGISSPAQKIVSPGAKLRNVLMRSSTASSLGSQTEHTAWCRIGQFAHLPVGPTM